jgi:CBS-domain-containing membrane protein
MVYAFRMDMFSDRARTRRGGLKGELALAIPPTVVVIGVIFLIENLTKERLLFASLAASAFLIYYDPMHRFNSVRVMVVAQLFGFIFGIGAAMALGPGYVAGAVAMVLTIAALILLDIVHPPAVSTALAFAFISTKDRTLLLFLVALVLIAALVFVQRTAAWTLSRIERYVARIEHEAIEKVEQVYADHIRHHAGHHENHAHGPDVAERAPDSEPAGRQ